MLSRAPGDLVWGPWRWVSGPRHGAAGDRAAVHTGLPNGSRAQRTGAGPAGDGAATSSSQDLIDQQDKDFLAALFSLPFYFLPRAVFPREVCRKPWGQGRRGQGRAGGQKRKAGPWEQPAGTETTPILPEVGPTPRASRPPPPPLCSVLSLGLRRPQATAHPPSLSGVPFGFLPLHLPAPPGSPRAPSHSHPLRCLEKPEATVLPKGPRPRVRPCGRWLGCALFLGEGVSPSPRGCSRPLSGRLLHARPLVPSPEGGLSGSRPCPRVLSLLPLGAPHLTLSSRASQSPQPPKPPSLVAGCPLHRPSPTPAAFSTQP